ncbi:hypothetical protein N657DRAFT_682711 [Parathielavia appendiculata]|uniref:Uncharacterized protein n=1 Tax=Parathielavia appendiculata TaxID=2587402 RepID=A0AAN6Z1Q2_9PEZI|nr:hypothetical protein N657DRAFT_682711 [Parathielavia appendiculata]
MVTAAVYSEVKRLYWSVQELVDLRRRKCQVQIISVLREKAAVSRLGVVHADADDTAATGLTNSAVTTTTTAAVPAPRPSRCLTGRHAAAGGGLLTLSPPPRLSIPIRFPSRTTGRQVVGVGRRGRLCLCATAAARPGRGPVCVDYHGVNFAA